MRVGSQLLSAKTLIEHALEKLRAVCSNPRIAGSRPDLAAFAPVVEDLHPGQAWEAAKLRAGRMPERELQGQGL
jgi:molybdopterin-guanine dinucleotide biosynthesis protein A